VINLEPIGHVRSTRRELLDDDWDAVAASIELTADFPPEALAGLEDFSHAEVIFHFDRVAESKIERGARHPRDNTAWPRVGITVRGLDAVDGTPVLDIEPVMAEFLPREALRQPAWSHELMREYWKA
jgi:tRNA (Thr-GGU) A37 N-methylase